LETFDVIINHQAREFGVVSSKIYNQFRKGKSYSIQIRWLDTNKPENELPDFDYFSEVEFINQEDSNGYLWIDSIHYLTKNKVVSPNGQKVLEDSRDAEGLPEGTGSGGSQDFLDTIALYRALLLNTDVVVLNDIETEPPVDGTVIEKTDKISYQLSLSISEVPVMLKNSIIWKRRQLKWDGTYEDWTVVENAKGHSYRENPANAGIFEVKAVIDGQDYIFKRSADDPHSSKKKGDNDCYGVVDEAWQVNVRDEAKEALGIENYAQGVKHSNVPKGPPGGWKCNLFVGHKLAASGVSIDKINGNNPFSKYYPTANQWAGFEVKPIPHWTLLPVETYPQPGFVAAYGRVDDIGHTGIMDYDGSWIAAGQFNVNRVPTVQTYNPTRVRKYSP